MKDIDDELKDKLILRHKEIKKGIKSGKIKTTRYSVEEFLERCKE